jgi:hypothetical protein
MPPSSETVNIAAMMKALMSVDARAPVGGDVSTTVDTDVRAAAGVTTFASLLSALQPRPLLLFILPTP